MHLIPPGVRAESCALITLYNSGDAGLGSSRYRREPPEWALMSPVGSDRQRHERERCKPAVTTLLRYADGGEAPIKPTKFASVRQGTESVLSGFVSPVNWTSLNSLTSLFCNFKSTFRQTSATALPYQSLRLILCLHFHGLRQVVALMRSICHFPCHRGVEPFGWIPIYIYHMSWSSMYFVVTVMQYSNKVM